MFFFGRSMGWKSNIIYVCTVQGVVTSHLLLHAPTSGLVREDYFFKNNNYMRILNIQTQREAKSDKI